MALSDHEIEMEISSGHLIFDPPLNEDQFSPSSVDLRVSNTFDVLETHNMAGVNTTVDLATIENIEDFTTLYGTHKVLAEGERLPIKREQLVLAYTREYLQLPKYLAGRIEGRSGFARLGLAVHQTAPTVHATFRGQLRLEIINNGPCTYYISPGLKICQLILERLGTPAKRSLTSLFQNQRQQ
jgi:dCTP deaminase